MAFSPEYAESLAGDLAAIYHLAETRLMEILAHQIMRGIDDTTWTEDKLLHIQALQQEASGFLAAMEGKTRDEIALALMKAYNRGDALARADLKLVDIVARNIGHPGLPPVESMVLEHHNRVLGTHGAILRALDDTYRDIVFWASTQAAAGVDTRLGAARTALADFAQQGIKGFTDKSGRRWQMGSYVEMATRAAVGNAAVQGHIDRLVSNGQDLVVVSDAPQECKLCRPWEGKVLTLMGVEPPPKGVKVAGSLAEAKREGLFHPGCRHSISLFIPGVTKVNPHGPTPDPKGDKDRKKLRYLERQVRRWKRVAGVAAISNDEAGLDDAAARVRAYQTQIRNHVASTSVRRQRHREQLGAL